MQRSLALAFGFALLAGSPVLAQQAKDPAPKAETPAATTPDAPRKDPVPDGVLPGAKKEEPKETPVDVKKKLEEVKTTVNFARTPLSEAFDFFNDMTGVHFVLDPSVDKTAEISLTASNDSLKDTLARTIAAAGGKTTYTIYAGVVYVTTKDKGQKEPPKAKLSAAIKKKLGMKLSLNLDQTSLKDVAEVLGDLTTVKFEVAKGLDVNVTATLKDASITDALDLLCRLTGSKLEADGETNVFKKR
jgi:type II secretory pathway component GspD/PulD (secretin)